MSLLTALLFAAAAWVWMGSSGRHRLPRVQGGPAPVERARPLPVLPAVAISSVAIAVLVGGILGVALGLVCWFILPRVVARLEPASARRRRRALQRQAPQAVELLAAVAECGATPNQALRVVARALGPPVGEDLNRIVSMMDLGASTEQAWSVLPEVHPLNAVGRTFQRTDGSGARLHDVLGTLAEDLRRRHRIEVQTAARSAGVRAVGPLAACFLPAFVLVGVVPVVASFAMHLL